MTHPTSQKTVPHKVWKTKLHVRGYELDSFGHVNHAVYISYLEHARWEMLLEEKITLETFRKWSRWPVIAALEVRYFRPAFLGDDLEIRTEITEGGRSRFSFQQTIYRRDEKIFEGTVQAVMVNEQGRPTSVPEELERLWKETLAKNPQPQQG
jgi:YbgC/YbaW family acyl-CoA thioester hydrolase